jgi:hypothetical protein
MAMALVDSMSISCLGSIYLLCEAPLTDDAWIEAEAHIPSLGSEFFLMIHDMHDIMESIWGEFFTIGICDPEDIARKLDRHDLRAEAYTEIGDLILSSILSRQDHPLYTSIPESSWNTDSIESFEEFCSLFLYIICLDEPEFDTFLMSKSGTLESLIERIVGILESDIFPYHTDTDDVGRRVDILEKFFPWSEIDFLACDTKTLENLITESLGVKCEWYTVDRVKCRRRYHMISLEP